MPRDTSTRRDWLFRIVLGALTVLTTAPAARSQTQTQTQTPEKPRTEEKPKAPPEKATEPVPKPGAWMKTHERFLARTREGDINLLFLGDSITAGWNGKNGKEIWDRTYGPRNAANFGIGGDRTQHVLWRIENGEVEGIKPRVAVLMIGTNNTGANTAAEIADGITLIVKRLREKLPDTKVLLLAVFPRGEKPSPNPGRQKLAEVNEKIASLGDGKMVVYLDIGKNFVNEDGTISKEIMPDFLHLSSKGYQIWADAIEPTLAKMLE